VGETAPEERLARAAAEQAALRRVATLVAAGAGEAELISALTFEIGRLFGAQRANTMRWDGDTIRVIGDWDVETGEMQGTGQVYSFGGDTITARVVESEAPARIDGAADLVSDFARERWSELGIEASIGAPIVVDGTVWGVVTASRTGVDDPFPPEAEGRLGDFAALVAQAISNAEARRETAALVAEQSALRRIATLVAAGRPVEEVLNAAAREVGPLYTATAVNLVRWEGVQDEFVVVASWSDDGESRLEAGSLYHPEPGGATIRVLETGFASRAQESSIEHGHCSVIAAPVIINAELLGALTALRPGAEMFPTGAEVRLRSFADLVAQSIANDRAQSLLRESRARIVRAADETRQRLERNLHDGAQQRLVSVSIALRLALTKLEAAPEARSLLTAATEELTNAIQELRDLARGLHPSVLTDFGLGPALAALARRAPFPVELSNTIDRQLGGQVEAALYYVVAESLTNVAKHAEVGAAEVHAWCTDQAAHVAISDNGAGSADAAGGTGLRGLADRVEALGGKLSVDSAPGSGTRVVAELPIS
jgi:signal transduction histidine kinase